MLPDQIGERWNHTKRRILRRASQVRSLNLGLDLPLFPGLEPHDVVGAIEGYEHQAFFLARAGEPVRRRVGFANLALLFSN
jgi:hypothetical protein